MRAGSHQAFAFPDVPVHHIPSRSLKLTLIVATLVSTRPPDIAVRRSTESLDVARLRTEKLPSRSLCENAGLIPSAS
jgi:hypothetical protein